MNFPAGFHIVHDGQAWQPLAVRDHQRLDGTETVFIDWQTNCPTCGDEFIITTGATFHTGRLVRRCQSCKHPGRRVSKERRDWAKDLAVSMDLPHEPA